MNYLKTKELEIGFYMGVPCDDNFIELESVSIPGQNGVPSNGAFHCRFDIKVCDFDNIANASRMKKVFQEQPFKEATINNEWISDTMRANRLKGEYDHPPRDSNKMRLKTVDRHKASHTIHDMKFVNKSCIQTWSTSGPFGEVLAKDIILNGEIPASSIRIFSTSRKVIDRAKGIRMSMGPYQFITVDSVMTPSNPTAIGLFKVDDEMAKLSGRKISALSGAYESEEYETIFKLEALYEGSDDVKFATEYLGLELEGYEDGIAQFKDSDDMRAFMKVEDRVAYDINKLAGKAMKLF